jgi:hypothetical protein
MPEFNVENFLRSLNEDEGAEGVDKAFAALSAKLPEAEYRAAVDSIEKWLESGLQKQIKENGVRGTKSRIREEAKDTPLSAAQISSQVVLHISKTKGDEASPLVKAFVRAAEKLTDEEYNSVQCAVKPMMAAIDAVVKEQAIAKPNPFRQKTPGKTG